MKYSTHPSNGEKPLFEEEKVQKKRDRFLSIPLLFSLFSALFCVVIVLGVSFGSTPLSPIIIFQILLNGTHVFHFPQHWNATVETIIWDYRLPTVVCAALVGAALSVAGVLFQGLLRNPLADPYLLGTSSGAALGASIAFLLPLETFYGAFFPLTPLLAFVGAMGAVMFVYGITRTNGQTPTVSLILAGVVINAVLIALQSLLLTLSPHTPFLTQALFNWLSGGIVLLSWPPIFTVGSIIVGTIVLSLGCARVLDIFALGEESATYLGIHVEQSKLLIVVVGSLLTAAAVSISGLVGFVGLVTPHMMRLWLGPNHRVLLPASAVSGAIFLILADLIARLAFAPTVLPVGIVTALVGAPFFFFLLKKSKREYQW